LGQVTDRYLGSTTGVIRQRYTYTQAENFRLTALQSGVSPNFNNLQNITYSYDDQGNVLTVVDAAAFGGSQTQTFTYDALNRLLTAQAAGGSNGTYTQRSYVYNNAGNIDSFEGVTQHYLDGAHKHAVTHVGGTTEAHRKYWYDNNGNATRRINASQVVTLTYGVENQVTSIIGSGVTPTSYLYDGDGKRVKATVGSGATQTNTVYIGNYYERDNGTTVRKYYYAGSVRVAMRTGGQTYYLLNDHLTSTAITTNSSGVRQTELRYFAYGGTRYDAGGQMTTYRYTGQRVETGTGLYDYGARWYDPAIGRFLAADSIVPNPGDSQALNRYMYVAGNPVKYVDPSGHGWVIPPPFQPILHILEDWGFLNPMAPFYLLPTALGVAEQRREAATGEQASEALAMSADWYFEQGSADRELGPDSQITQALIRDEGVAQARQVYMQGGNRDARPYRYTFGLSDAAREFRDVIERGDWSTSFLGGYEVQIKTVGVETRHTVAEFTVINRTGWESATRVWGISFKQDEPRRDPGPGGTMTQRYQWRERVARRANSSQRGMLAQ
jgi:RHS repeat-associated protein